MDEMTEKKKGVFAGDFLWGGAVAAHQLEGGYLEGGKGLSIMDVTTGGDVHTLRRFTHKVLPGENYPNHEAIDFYHRTSACLQRWDLSVFGPALRGPGFSLWAMRKSRMRMDCVSMMTSLTNV